MYPIARAQPARQRGVTLIELMTVLAIVAILGSIALSSYRKYVIRTNRTDATAQLLRIQVAEEKYFLQNGSYATDSATMTTSTAANPPGLGVASTTTPGGYYTLSIGQGPSGDNTTYVVSATATGTQTQDSSTCLVFKIDYQGTRTPADSSGCWH